MHFAAAKMVFIDSSPENLIPELSLRAERVLDDTWNGWLRPWATARSAAAMSAAWRANDPNGLWGDVAEVDGQLVWARDDGDDPDTFPLVGVTGDGQALYDLTGWCWIHADTSDAESQSHATDHDGPDLAGPGTSPE